MKLVPLMTYYARLNAALAVGSGMYGNRLIVLKLTAANSKARV